MRPCSLNFEQSFYRWLLNSGGPLQWRGLNKDSVAVLLSLHTNRNKLKGSEDFKWNNIGLVSLWFVWFCRHAWFRLMISCRLHVSRIILMRERDSKYWEIYFNRAFIITWSRKNITNQCLPRVACFKTSCLPFVGIMLIREFKITTTATAAATPLNKRFNEQNNGSARAL